MPVGYRETEAMRVIEITAQKKRVVNRPKLSAVDLREFVGGGFEGIPLPSPDKDLPEGSRNVFLYYHELGKRADLSPNFRLGRGGQIIYGPAMIVGVEEDRNRDLTDYEIEGLHFFRPMIGALPILRVRGITFPLPSPYVG